MGAIAQQLRGARSPEQAVSLRVGVTLWKDLAWFCLFEAAFYIAYRYGMSFSQTCASPFWFPDSVLLCALLLSPPRRWWIFILGALPIRLFSAVAQGVAHWFLLATFVNDSVKGILVAALLRRYVSNPIRLQTLREFWLFSLFAVLLVPAASAFAGAANRHAIGDAFWTAWQQWFMGDAMAQLVLTPAILYWTFGAPWRAWKASMPPAKRMVEAGFLALGLMVSSYIAFSRGHGEASIEETRFFAPVPFLFWAALRFGMLGASGAILVMAFFSVEAALAGRGPFSGQSPSGTAAALQYFLLWRAAPLYLVAILVEQTSASARSVRETEQKLAHVARLAVVGELTAMIGHEVNQPLCAILANAGAGRLLLEEPNPPLEALREIVESIGDEGRRAGETIAKLRALLGKREIELKPLNMNDLIADVLSLVKGDALRRKVHIRKEVDPNIPLVSGDHVQLQQLLLNLIVNGMDAIDMGPALQREIVLKTAHNHNGCVRVSVNDSGPGIPPERLANVFDAFFTTKKEGMGLGLAIARSIVKAHGGRICVQSNGHGATFTFEIPAAVARSF